jgi:prepilin peptidase CpaA
MNLLAMAPTWLLGLLAAALVIAAIEDAVRLRISHLSVAGVLIAGLIAMGLQGFPLALWQNWVVFAAILAIGTPLFAAGKVGGGDVKLLAAVGLWVDLRTSVWLIAAVFLAGGVLAIIFLTARLFRSRQREGKEKIGSKGIPYGLAIVVGAAFIFFGQQPATKARPERPNPHALNVI